MLIFNDWVIKKNVCAPSSDNNTSYLSFTSVFNFETIHHTHKHIHTYVKLLYDDIRDRSSFVDGGEEVCEAQKKLMEYNDMKDNYFTSR